jgi:hypothetical protein
LNHRPLGYEFNTWFWMDSAIAKNQSDTVSMFWIISIVSGSPVSNLLALFGLQPTRPDPNNRGPSAGSFKRRQRQIPAPLSLRRSRRYASSAWLATTRGPLGAFARPAFSSAGVVRRVRTFWGVCLLDITVTTRYDILLYDIFDWRGAIGPNSVLTLVISRVRHSFSFAQRPSCPT